MKKILFAAVVAALFCSCAKDETTATPTNEGKLVYRELTADIAPIGRAVFGEVENNTVGLWLEEGDEILFVDSEKNGYTGYVTKAENGTVTVGVTAPENTPLKACYPFWAYDTNKRNNSDVANTEGTNGELHVDRYQFMTMDRANYYTATFSEGYDNDLLVDDFSLPVALTGEVAANSTSFTMEADNNAAILAIPVKGDAMLEKILVYYTDSPVDFNGENTNATHELHYIHTQLTSEPQMFYVMVNKTLATDDSKYIAIQLQTSTVPYTADNTTAYCTTKIGTNYQVTASGKARSSRKYGYRFTRRSNSPMTIKSGINQLPVFELNKLTEETDTRYMALCGTSNVNKQQWSISNGNKVEMQDTYELVTMKHNGAESDANRSGRGDIKITVPANIGNYRYFAIKTDARAKITNTAIWTNAAGVIKLSANGSINYDKWKAQSTTPSRVFEHGCADGAQILVFDLLATFRYANSEDRYIPTTKTENLTLTLTVADMKYNTADYPDGFPEDQLTYKVYWTGFFSSADEITFFASNGGKQ